MLLVRLRVDDGVRGGLFKGAKRTVKDEDVKTLAGMEYYGVFSMKRNALLWFRQREVEIISANYKPRHITERR